MRTSWSPKPRGSASARRSSPTTSSCESAFSTNTLQRDSSAPFTSNEGFSVVAPMSVMAPFSTKGRNASCCALLKRWISSTNTMVRRPMRVSASARFMTSRISLMPLVTAEKSMNLARVWAAMTRASVVLPTPGGPQNTIEGTWSASIMRRSTLPGPMRWDWPATSSSVRGRMRAASGAVASMVSSVSNRLPCSSNDNCMLISLVSASCGRAGLWNPSCGKGDQRAIPRRCAPSSGPACHSASLRAILVTSMPFRAAACHRGGGGAPPGALTQPSGGAASR